MNTWKHCSVHGPGDENSWGCPECVRELRKAVAERDARIAELEKALEKHNKMHGEWTLILLSDGRVTNIPGFETEEACVCAGKNILLHWNWPYVKFVCVNTNGNVKGDR